MAELNAEVPFPALGEGVFLRFTFNNLVALEEVFGREEMFGTIEAGCREAQASVVLECLQVAAKTKDEEGRYAKFAVDGDALDFPISEAATPILDALCLAQSGRLYSDILAEATERAAKEIQARKKMTEDGLDPDDPFGLMATLAELSKSGTSPDSDPPKSEG